MATYKNGSFNPIFVLIIIAFLFSQVLKSSSAVHSTWNLVSENENFTCSSENGFGLVFFPISTKEIVNPTTIIDPSCNCVQKDGVERGLSCQNFCCPNNTLLPGVKLGYNSYPDFVVDAGFTLYVDVPVGNLTLENLMMFQENDALRIGKLYKDSTLTWSEASGRSPATSADIRKQYPSRQPGDSRQLRRLGRLVDFNSSYVSTFCKQQVSPTPAISPLSTKTSISGEDLHLRRSGNKRIWILIAIAIFLGLLILGRLCYLRRLRKHRIEGEERTRQQASVLALTSSNSFNNADEIENPRREGHDFKIFKFASITAATNNFSDENKLGEGGYGPVYKGQLLEGREIAVKRLSRTSAQGLDEFKNELILTDKLQHINLVRVLGCCIHGEETMIVYEYLPNKSLDSFLFDPAKREQLDWQKRLNIINGIAQGLLYLHKYSRKQVIHRDLKASNILLDKNMNPKISDFGIARLFNPNETEAITSKIVGTLGYISPEYVMGGIFSVKSDVFSFGVLIIEIVSGKKNNTFYDLDRPLNLIGYAWELWKGEAALELKDPTLGDSCAGHEVLRTIHVGLLCVQESATDRPTMSQVISLLSNETVALPVPKQPAFCTGRDVLESTSRQFYTASDSFISVTEA